MMMAALARERVCDGASGRGGHAGGGSERSGEGRTEDGVGGGRHGTEMGERGVGPWGWWRTGGSAG
jgi:hypothetical protein